MLFDKISWSVSDDRKTKLLLKNSSREILFGKSTFQNTIERENSM